MYFILYFTALAVVDGTITLGTMLAIQYVLGQLNRPMMDFSMIIGQWLDAKLSLNRINEFSGDEKRRVPAAGEFSPAGLFWGDPY